MDNFESIIATLLEAKHYWVQRSFKINVPPGEKELVGKHSIPRPEIDLLALNFKKNEVIAFEVKSFLNSPGVKLTDLQKEHPVQEGRYKLFTSQNYRKNVLEWLRQDLIKKDMADSGTTVRLGLAAGRVYQRKTEQAHTQSNLIREFLESKDFVFLSPEDIREKLMELAGCAFVNDPAIMAAKVLFPELRK